jgi:glycosyltransferase involved in cell wall biosynthesis
MTIGIYSPSIVKYDAIGNFCSDIFAELEKRGKEVVLFSQSLNPEFPQMKHLNLDELSDLQTFSHLVLNFSAFDTCLPQLLEIRGPKKIIFFHGITPPDLLMPESLEMSQKCRLGLAQIPALNASDIIFANSEFSSRQLRENGVQRQIFICPPTFSTGHGHLKKIEPKKPNFIESSIISVGRISPHKRPDRIIEICELLFDKGWRGFLYLIGPGEQSTYGKNLNRMISSSRAAEHIRLTGAVTQQELTSHYRNASLLISASEHEGFCVPVFEALKSELACLVKSGTATTEIFSDLVHEFSDILEASSKAEQILSSFELLNFPDPTFEYLNKQKSDFLKHLYH